MLLGKKQGEFLLMGPVYNVKKIMRKVLLGTITLPERYSELIVGVGCREQKILDFGRGYVVTSVVRVSESV